MSLRDNYVKKINMDGTTRQERDVVRLTREFDKLLQSSPSSVNVDYITIGDIILENKARQERVIVNDNKMNDKSFFDEKLIFCRRGTSLGVGSYITIDDEWYLIIFEERRPHKAYREFVARICTGEITVKREWMYTKEEMLPVMENEICHIPIVVENLTLYSEGVKEINYGMLSIVDGKRNITYGSDPRFHTFMTVGRRFMLMGETAFNVTHIDNFTFTGITKITAMQSVVVPEDNKELNIADYYSTKASPSKDMVDIPNLSDYRLQLVGVPKIKIGSKQLYEASIVGLEDKPLDLGLDWQITHIKGKESDITAELISNKTLSIKAVRDLDIIGGQLNIRVSIQDEPGVFVEKKVDITSIMG